MYKKVVDFYSKSKLIDKLLAKPIELIIVYKINLYHAQEFYKNTYNKIAKPKSYFLDYKTWLNDKYIKKMQN